MFKPSSSDLLLLLPSTFFGFLLIWLLHTWLRGGVNYLHFNILGRVFSVQQLPIAMRQLSGQWDSYESYPTVIKCTWQLSVLSNSYQLYPPVISSMRQLWVLSASYQLYPTVNHPIRQLAVLCDSYQLYATVISSNHSYESYPTVISSMRQLLVLCDSYQSYLTVISSIRQLIILFNS